MNTRRSYTRQWRPKQSRAEAKAGFIRADRINKELDRQFKLAVERPNT
tara:strand:+ start:145 stop:288 length:144 start_codon:yes stop_codon:yes gene_type:complete